MKAMNLYEYLSGNEYPGRGIVLGRSADGNNMLIGYFSSWAGAKTAATGFLSPKGTAFAPVAFDPAKLSDPSLIIYSPVRVLGAKAPL